MIEFVLAVVSLDVGNGFFGFLVAVEQGFLDDWKSLDHDLDVWKRRIRLFHPIMVEIERDNDFTNQEDVRLSFVFAVRKLDHVSNSKLLSAVFGHLLQADIGQVYLNEFVLFVGLFLVKVADCDFGDFALG